MHAAIANLLAATAAAAEPHVVIDRDSSFIDQRLAAATAVALFREPRVSGEEVGDIAVVARDDRVVLRGVVDTAEARRAASSVAGRVPGVKTVDNRLDVAPATASAPRADEHIARDVASLLRGAQPLDGAHIRVRVGRAQVELFGSVGDVGDWALASRIARRVTGVHAVKNHLVIEHLDLMQTP